MEYSSKKTHCTGLSENIAGMHSYYCSPQAHLGATVTQEKNTISQLE